MSYLLLGKVAVISGASQGFGFEVARNYLLAGASLAICALNEKRLHNAYLDLLPLVKPGQKIYYATTDVSKKSNVEFFMRNVIDRMGKIDILINNAGIYGPMGEIDLVSWDDWVRSIEVNLFGSVLMSRAVLPYFKAQRSGKIIQLSGGGATAPMPKISGYAVSKAAVVRFVETLAEEVRHYGVEVNAIAPGALNTGMLDEVIDAGPDRVGKEFFERALEQKKSGGSPLEAGVNLAVFLGSNASDGITGKLISALWDNWAEWPLHLKDLNDSDVYTLRRIKGDDRGYDWGDK
jgi:NAD(P)-dependent dehydrogenase (short-subunit alcohol dehydrogenase family)